MAPNLVVNPSLVNAVVLACEQAGQAIRGIYRDPLAYDVRYKADHSPITAADERAHHILTSSLSQLSPELPVLSEESDQVPFEQRSHWSQYWLVDPLDGTREFIERTGEFTVNVALIDQGEPVFGVIHAPMLEVSYWGACGLGAYKRTGKSDQVIRVRTEHDRQKGGFILVQSRRHGKQASTLSSELRTVYETVNTVDIGSSLKYALIAEGQADACLREAPTCEWDTGAAQALLEAAGGCFFFQGQAARYNQKASLLNPHFFAMGELSGRLQLWTDQSLMPHWNTKV